MEPPAEDPESSTSPEPSEAHPESEERPAEEPSELARLQAQVQAEREQRIRAEALLQAQKDQQSQTQKTRQYSRAQLQQAVDSGRLTEGQMEQILEKQRQVSLKDQIRTQAEAIVAQREQQSKLQSKMDRYIERYPGLRQPGSEEFNRASRELQRIVEEYGYDPKDGRTELLAVERAFGPAEKVKERTRRETPKETGAPGGGTERAQNSNLVHGVAITKELRSYLQRQIDNGQYPGGWDDPAIKRQMKYVKAG